MEGLSLARLRLPRVAAWKWSSQHAQSRHTIRTRSIVHCKASRPIFSIATASSNDKAAIHCGIALNANSAMFNKWSATQISSQPARRQSTVKSVPAPIDGRPKLPLSSRSTPRSEVLPHRPKIAKRTPIRLKLPYHVSRTSANNLPIYLKYTSHRTLKLTLLRKISGDATALKNQLIEFLRVEPKDAVLTSPANYIRIKGKHAEKIQEFLLARGF